jgi:hypothetical protein
MAEKNPHDDADEIDVLEEADETLVMPPPMAPPPVPHPYSNPIPFGAPPEEPVTLAPDEIPWELREE